MSSNVFHRPKTNLETGLTIATIIAVSVSCVVALQRHQQLQSEQNYQTIVDRVREQEKAGDYPGCIHGAATIPQNAEVYSEARRYWQSCQDKQSSIYLKRASERAQKGELAQAIREAAQVSERTSMYGQAQQRIEQWSKRMVEIAEKHYMHPKNRFNFAVRTLEAIPPSSPFHAAAEARVQQWRQIWTNNEQYWSNAEEALEEGELDFALSEAQKITNHPFWTPRRTQIIRAVEKKQLQQKYETLWKEAQRLLTQKEPENAIEVVRDLPDTYPWGERKQQLVNKAEAMQRRTAVCQTVSFGLFNCY